MVGCAHAAQANSTGIPASRCTVSRCLVPRRGGGVPGARPEVERLLVQAVERLGLSARGHDRVLRVARTIADLTGADTIRPEHVAEAIQYRGLDRQWRG